MAVSNVNLNIFFEYSLVKPYKILKSQDISHLYMKELNM